MLCYGRVFFVCIFSFLGKFADSIVLLAGHNQDSGFGFLLLVDCYFVINARL